MDVVNTCFDYLLPSAFATDVRLRNDFPSAPACDKWARRVIHVEFKASDWNSIYELGLVREARQWNREGKQDVSDHFWRRAFISPAEHLEDVGPFHRSGK